MFCCRVATAASESAFVFPGMPRCPGTHRSVGRWFLFSFEFVSSMRWMIGCVGVSVVCCMAVIADFESVTISVLLSCFSCIVR